MDCPVIMQFLSVLPTGFMRQSSNLSDYRACNAPSGDLPALIGKGLSYQGERLNTKDLRALRLLTFRSYLLIIYIVSAFLR